MGRLPRPRRGRPRPRDRAQPADPEILLHRGIVWQRLGELARALQDLDEAVRLRPEEACYYHQRAMARLYDGPEGSPLEEALPDLEEAIRLDPDTPRYRNERATSASAKGGGRTRLRTSRSRTTVTRPRASLSWAPRWSSGSTCAALPEETGRGLGSGPGLLPLVLARLGGPRAGRSAGEEARALAGPLSGLVAGQIDGQQLLGTKRLELARPGLVECEIETATAEVKECYFVLAELAWAAGRRDEATAHLRSARGLPRRNPMSWVVASQLAEMPEV